MTKIIKNSDLPKKRRLASLEGCKTDLKDDLPSLFKAFQKAFQSYESEVIQTPPLARSRGFEASLLNSKMIQSIQEVFSEHWKFGKYKRFTLRIKGYIILFKKLNKSGMPMNVKTKAVSAISQQLSLPLFDQDFSVSEPILFFGYEKNRLGEIVDPRLVYIDEDQVRWNLSEDDLDSNISLTPVTTVIPPAAPKLKEGAKKKAANQ